MVLRTRNLIEYYDKLSAVDRINLEKKDYFLGFLGLGGVEKQQRLARKLFSSP
jgi:hypothetical protein